MGGGRGKIILLKIQTNSTGNKNVTTKAGVKVNAHQLITDLSAKLEGMWTVEPLYVRLHGPLFLPLSRRLFLCNWDLTVEKKAPP